MTVLMASSPTPTPMVDPSTVGPGSAGFWIVIGLLVAGVLLWLSMRRHMRKVQLPHAEKQQRGQIPLARDPEDPKGPKPPEGNR